MIETARLVLRPLEETDLPLIIPALGNFNVSRNTGRIPHPYTAADAADYFAWLKTQRAGSLSLCIDVKGARRAAGGIGLVLIGEETVPELGYWLAEEMWGRGYGFEAAAAVVRHALGPAGFTAVKASYHVGNEASRRILARIGFVDAGFTKTFAQARGVEVETRMMALSRA